MDKQKRKHHILNVARKCFEENGYNQTSMDFLASSCGLTKRTVYKYYRSKDELYYDLVCEAFEHFESLYKEIPEDSSSFEQISMLMDCYINFFEKDCFYADLMVTRKVYNYDDPVIIEKIDYIKSYSKRIPLPRYIQKGIEEGMIRSDIDPNQQALIIWGALHGVIEIAVNKPWHLPNGDVKSFLMKSKEMLMRSMMK